MHTSNWGSAPSSPSQESGEVHATLEQHAMANALPFDETHPPHALPCGTLLNEKFRLQRVIGVGGFGIVYLAHDEMSDVNVAIKEYMPISLAGRTKTMQVSLTSQSNAETFALGLKSFWNEARLLARFRDEELPLLKVYDAFQANGTAYMVMPVLRGRTTYQVRREMPKPPNERWLRTLLTDLLPALDRLHAENVYHRDIAPDNIQIDIHAKPVLMDLGAARHVISNRTQSITAILKPGYAPIEQYGENDKLRQGPWTDLYALGATLHFLLLNKAPASATVRFYDPGPPLATQNLPGCSTAFLRVVDWMLAVAPKDRPQSVAQLRAALGQSDETTRIMAPKAAQAAPRGLAPAGWAGRWANRSAVTMVLASIGAVALAGGSAAWLWPRQAAPGIGIGTSTSTSPARSAMSDTTLPMKAPQPAEARLETPPMPATLTAAAATQATPQHPAAEPARPLATQRASLPGAKPPAGKKPLPSTDKADASLKAAEPTTIAAAPEPPPPEPPAPVRPAIEPAASPARPAIASPSERCSGKDGFARTLCVSLVCGVPELHNHAQCMALRRN